MTTLPNKRVKEEDIVLEAKNFFQLSHKAKNEITAAMKRGAKSVPLDFTELTELSNKLADQIINDPETILRYVEIALEELGWVKRARVRLINLPKIHEIKIRNIRAKNLNEIVFLEGIIRQASDVRPQVVNAKFECPSCGTIISVLQMSQKFTEPLRCSCGRRAGFKVLSKEMVDTQRLVVEESPESLVGGEQPKRLDVFVKEDLVDPKMEERTTPGSRVKVVGVLKEVQIPLRSGGVSTRFELVIEANNVIPLEETFEELDISEEDERQILELSQDPEIFETLSKSIAPSVWGHTEIKQSMVLQLFGGVQKVTVDGQKQRGDLHILLIGDPGVAKSVMLAFMAEISPKGRYVVGKSASGAGLTATVVRDEFLKGWSLEAGAMVLANKGLVCIDELEKMDPQDRSAMHEAMEQQSITISKANVQASLRAQTSVLAAANPKYGRFDPHQSIGQQLDLPPTLINRFDVLFALRDIPDKERDERVADHVLSEHRAMHNMNYVPRPLFRKYVAYAKQRFKPKLSSEAVQVIKDFYITLRNKPVSGEGSMRSIPITARQLQALVRMSEAAARIRLSEEVTANDARKAVNLLQYSLMQVGYDPETKTFDIDRISSRTTSSERNKIYTVRETIASLEDTFGKQIPVEEIEKALEGKLTRFEVEECLESLKKHGELYIPKRGFVGRV